DKLSFIDAAPILCAGVTTYKGLKQTEAKPGEWVVISGVGGLGHVAVQYAKGWDITLLALVFAQAKFGRPGGVGVDWQGGPEGTRRGRSRLSGPCVSPLRFGLPPRRRVAARNCQPRRIAARR